MNLSHLKVGDEVFVVDQRNRYSVSNNRPARTYFATITKVGRKYAYIGVHGRDLPFHRADGTSHHKEWNSRANGFGFDVYDCEASYVKKQAVDQEFARLQTRLVDRWGKMHPLGDDVVSKIHDLLDAEGLE